MDKGTCEIGVGECSKHGRISNGWCPRHYGRMLHYGHTRGGPRLTDECPQIEGERWLPIAGFEGSYEVSDYGRIRSLPRTIIDGRYIFGHVLRPGTDARGYKRVTLYAGGRSRTTQIHRAVAEAFLRAPLPGQQARHMDGNPSNNLASNVQWGTAQENHDDRIRHGTASGWSRLAPVTHCSDGHEFTPENTYAKNGKRWCRKCKNRRAEASRQKRLTRLREAKSAA